MAKYNLYAGMGGSFGGAQFHCCEEYRTEEEASQAAYELAVEEYQSYEGMHGIASQKDITEEYCEENGVDEADLTQEDKDFIYDSYLNEVEGWIEYYAVLASEDPDAEDEEEDE